MPFRRVVNGADWTLYGPNTTGAVPTGADSVWIAKSGGTVTMASGVSGVCSTLTIGGTGPVTGPGCLSVSGGTLVVGSNIEMTQYGPSNSYPGTILLSGGSISAPIEYVGYSSGTTFTQTGGTNNVTSLYLGSAATSQTVAVNYSLNGGVLSVGGLAKNTTVRARLTSAAAHSRQAKRSIPRFP